MKVLDSFHLKLIALISMILDHVAIILIPMSSPIYLIFRILGRLAMPIYAFLIVEGINHSKNVFLYLIRLFIIGVFFDLASYLVAGLNIGNTFTAFGLTGLFLYLISHKETKYKLYSLIPLSIIILSLTSLIPLVISYNLYGILIISFFFISKEISKLIPINHQLNEYRFELYKVLGALSFVVITCIFYVFQGELISISPVFIMDYNIQTYSLIAIIFILCYNGLRGYDNPYIKWGFYIAYPLHIIIIIIINLLINNNIGG